jgi:hypothetical protein
MHRGDISVFYCILTLHRTTLRSIKQEYSVQTDYKITTSKQAQLVHTYEPIERNVFKIGAADFLTKEVNNNNLVLINQSQYRPIRGPVGSRRLKLPSFETVGT